MKSRRSILGLLIILLYASMGFSDPQSDFIDTLYEGTGKIGKKIQGKKISHKDFAGKIVYLDIFKPG